MSVGPLFEWAGAVIAPAPRAPARDVDPRVVGSFILQGQECACVLHLGRTPGPCSVDVRDRAGRQLQGFDGDGFAQVLRDVRDAGVDFNEDDARKIGRALVPRGSQGIGHHDPRNEGGPACPQTQEFGGQP